MLPQVNFRLSIPVLVFIGLAWLGVVLIFWHVGPANREVIKFAAEFLGGAAAIYALFLSTQSARSAAGRRFIERWTDPNFASLRTAVSELLIEKKKPEDMERQTLLAILNLWEEIAITVFSHEAD